ncbi:MAG: tetratricopeptide repeat protein [Ignavibacteria bacterium]|nr:tetratricopeptide repeat protein [Ignavibacteria bacterium]MBI3765412.1 tetratricopeptide repeat protein [Ignavibacteriales bacterium]
MSTTRLDTLQQFLEQDPNDPFNHYAIALEYVSSHCYPEAIAKFQELMALDPNYVPAYHQLGLLFARLGKNDEALKTFERGIEIAALVGDMHARSEMEEAIDELEK